jgi:adenylate kinase family enzyme
MSGVHLIGASGSGTSTLGRAVADATGWRLLDADDFYWLPTVPPYRLKRDRPDRIARLAQAFEDAVSGGVVLAGSVVGWGDDVVDACDLIVYLTVPTSVRLVRLREREVREVGAVDEEFLAWASRYDDGGLDVRSRALHEHWLERRRPAVLRVEGTPPLDESLRLVLDELKRVQQVGNERT